MGNGGVGVGAGDGGGDREVAKVEAMWVSQRFSRGDAFAGERMREGSSLWGGLFGSVGLGEAFWCGLAV